MAENETGSAYISRYFPAALIPFPGDIDKNDLVSIYRDYTYTLLSDIFQAFHSIL